jgi:translation initiation factor IF-2
LGAYRAHTDHGDLVFIDTPGHEAFPMMRARGIAVADIAIIVIAADDGIMPQTLEAIKRAQLAGLSLIVAINKIDKASEAQIEALKGQLSRNDLLPEDWGGSTICVPISALTGKGVDELLEVVVLQSQVLELTTSLDVPAFGYVLESLMEKGRGPVATVICQDGVLRVGDNFICGDIAGRVSSLKNSAGKSVKSVEPSNPVQVAGFSILPQAGDVFKVASARDVRRGRISSVAKQPARIAQSGQEKSMGLLIKTDTASSQEALLGSIQKMTEKFYSGIHVLQAGVGAITESDVSLAADTGSLIYGLHTKIEPSASLLAQRLKVKVKIFDIIYKLLEDLQDAAEVGRPIKMKTEKTGEAVVLKVFDIKKIGVVAGARMLSGHCDRKGTIVVYRQGKRVGEGKITSLQKERNNVKEVRKGFECAFMIEGFDGWQVDDHADCFMQVPEV